MVSSLFENIVSDATRCPDEWQSLDTSCYGHFKDEAGLTWLRAEKSCQTHNAHLVSIGSDDEVAYLHHLLTTDWMNTEKDIYIGLLQ